MADFAKLLQKRSVQTIFSLNFQRRAERSLERMKQFSLQICLSFNVGTLLSEVFKICLNMALAFPVEFFQSVLLSSQFQKQGWLLTCVFEADLKLEQLNWNEKYVCSSKHEAECYILSFSFGPCSRIASRSSTVPKSCGPLENCCLIVISDSSAVVQGTSRIKFT